MYSKKKRSGEAILIIIAIVVLIMGILLFFVPPSLFPDPAMGFQVLRSMQSGSGFNVFTNPDQSDISQNYSEFLTWWSPGQYLVPWLFKVLFHVNIGKGIAIAVSIAQLSGLAGFYFFLEKSVFRQRYRQLAWH